MLDSHCHINDEALYPDRANIIKEAKERGVTEFLVVGWDIESSRKAIEIANEFEGVYAAIGIHPENLYDASEENLNVIKELSKDKKVVAIGEIGLDYHWFKEMEHREKQKEWFIKQIDLANELGLPISIHGRDASQDIYNILKEHPVKNGGVLHCYSGSKEMLKEFAKLKLYFGFDGPVTFKNAVEPKECVKECPLDRLLSETDSPYLTPVPYRGKTNYPKYIKEIVEQIASLKESDTTTIESQIKTNFEKLFHVEHK